MRRITHLFLALTLALSLSVLVVTSASAHCGACGADGGKDHPHDIVETAEAAGTFGTLLAAAKAAGMVDALKQKGPITVFAPTDAAFKKLPKGTVEGLLKDPAKLKAILSFHVVAGKVDSKAAAKAGKAKSLLGKTLKFSKSGKGLKVQNAAITKADLETKNGYIHVIDTVLLPPKG